MKIIFVRKRIIFIVGIIIIGIAVFILYLNKQSKSELDNQIEVPQYVSLINTTGCQIPSFEAFSTAVNEYYRRPAPLNCSRKSEKYNEAAETSENAETILHEPPPESQCFYQVLLRPHNNDNTYISDFLDHRINPLKLNETLESPDTPEFINLKCHNSKNVMYQDFKAFIPLKEKVESRCEQIVKEEVQLNVVILGVDSLSRLHMLRHLPETYELLQKSLSATTVLGYNKIDDNTYPNVIAFLTGLCLGEFHKACNWQSKGIDKFFNNWKYHTFDSCPIIWKDFAAHGYRTMYGEDCTKLSIFNFERGGFENQPTDYYPRPILQAFENHYGHTATGICKLCLGARSSAKFLLDYTEDFVRRFASIRKRHFSFTWVTTITHDIFNTAGLADEPCAKILKGMIERNDLENTALFFISDHGIRFGAFNLTPQGRQELRLPFLAVALPEWFKQKYPMAVKNLEINANNRLTSPFDVHQTFRDLLSPTKFMQDGIIQERMQDSDTMKSRGISLFLEIPENRTCDSAGIQSHWCTCRSMQPHEPLNVDDPIIKDAALAFVNHINQKYLSGFPECHPLTLEKVTEVRNATSELSLTIQTTPGGGIFEGDVKILKADSNSIKFKTADAISRLNRYGKQSHCISDWIVKLFCFCYKEFNSTSQRSPGVLDLPFGGRRVSMKNISIEFSNRTFDSESP